MEYCNQKLRQVTRTNEKQISGPPETEKGTESLMESGVRGNSNCGIPQYLQHTQTDKDTQFPPSKYFQKISHSKCTHHVHFTASHFLLNYRYHIPSSKGCRHGWHLVMYWTVIITCSSASPRLLCGMAMCNYCQHSNRHPISHTQTAMYHLSQILAYLHMSK